MLTLNTKFNRTLRAGDRLTLGADASAHFPASASRMITLDFLTIKGLS